MARRPSVLRWRCSDGFVTGLGWCGVALAALLVAGVPQLGPWWVPALAFLVLWAAYLSVVNAGGRFYGFGWESLLCEVTFLVAFLGSSGGAGARAPLPRCSCWCWPAGACSASSWAPASSRSAGTGPGAT
ncbi:hypothetical protein [Cellulosimicrobium sp. CUA-896]|uniref:hypothetical protein n=1 Tax=Cellulosimicrobium sp. CUA-896 TaxID=1517881 RepID=UPI0035140D30